MRLLEVNGQALGKRFCLKFDPQFTPQIWIVCGDQGCGKSVLLHSIFKAVVTAEPKFKRVFKKKKIIGSNIQIANGYKITCDDAFCHARRDRVIFMARNRGLEFDYGQSLFDKPAFDHAWDTCGRVDPRQLHLYRTENGRGKLAALEQWVKSIPEQSVVLMDNLEDGLSADNQYNLTRWWLEEWNPTAQFIIASHSYEMCQPLPPAHILAMHKDEDTLPLPKEEVDRRYAKILKEIESENSLKKD